MSEVKHGFHHFLTRVVHEGSEIITLFGGLVLVVGAALATANLFLVLTGQLSGLKVNMLLEKEPASKIIINI